MEKVAIMVDGGFFCKRAVTLWGKTSPQNRAKELCDHCLKHLTLDYKHPMELYRIFYYDCPPSDKNIQHPLTLKTVNLAKSDQYKWMMAFHDELRKKRKLALRLGRLSDAQYVLKTEVAKRICNGKKLVDDLSEEDFTLDIKQKGVDMKLGVDIASVAYKKQVSQIILISGDSDFVPAAKAARREGIDFILDPMFSSINSDLQEHVDGLRSPKYKKITTTNGDETENRS